MRAAFADEPRAQASEADLAKAKKLFDQALEAIHGGRFAEAEKELRASLDIAPRAATAFNLAIAQRGTGDAIDALALFDKLDDGAFGALDAAKREQLATLRTEVAADIATVTIHATGAGSIELRLDGEIIATVADGETTKHRLNPGAHRLVATAADHETFEKAVDVARGQTFSVDVALRPAADRRPGHVLLECSEKGATIVIDGHGSAIGHLERDLAPGEYTVRVRSSSDERTVRLAVPAGRTIKLELDPPSKSIVQRPWFWIVTGVLVTGGAATAAVLATRPHKTEPVSDKFWGVTTTSFRF